MLLDLTFASKYYTGYMTSLAVSVLASEQHVMLVVVVVGLFINYSSSSLKRMSCSRTPFVFAMFRPKNIPDTWLFLCFVFGVAATTTVASPRF